MLVFVRHGECVANRERLYVGRSESPLTERGSAQAERLAAAVASSTSAARLLTSPLGRARRTAEVIAEAAFGPGGRARVENDERFVELDYGELDGQPIAARAGEASRPHAKGEPLAEADARVRAACEELYRLATRAGPEGGDVVVVSHVVPIKLAVCWALGVPAGTIWRMDLAVASITRISTRPLLPHLESYNERAHLGEDASPPFWR